MPVLTVIAGPNGSGKSTLTSTLDFEDWEYVLDPDAIARQLDPRDPPKAAIAAGREVLQRMRRYMDERRSFAIETTLASKKTLNWIREAKSHGFTVRLIYLCLDTPEHNMLRVRARVARGGHDVEDQDIRRRYHRSLANLPEAIGIADEVIIYDNTKRTQRRILELRNGSIVWEATDEPEWLTEIRAALIR